MSNAWKWFFAGIFLECYVGFKLVFTFPDEYPHFRWLFALLEHASNK